jgi:hypothetical protein
MTIMKQVSQPYLCSTDQKDSDRGLELSYKDFLWTLPFASESVM